MNDVFTKENLYVGVTKNSDGTIKVQIGSMYKYSNRKSQLWVNEKSLAIKMEQEWARLKEITRKITKFSIHFEEEDWYDSMCDMYETPVIILEKGKTKAKISSHDHGSIPKEWSVMVNITFSEIKQKKVILESIKCVLGYLYSQEIEKVLDKTNEVLSGKKNHISYDN